MANVWESIPGALGLPPLAPDIATAFTTIGMGTCSWLGNTLAPGFAPVEFSFSDLQPDCLRVAVQLGGERVSPAERVASSCRLLADHRDGVDLALPEMLAATTGATAFGAYVGVVHGVRGEVERKVYLEVGEGAPLPTPLCAAAALARSWLPTLRPHMISVGIRNGSLRYRLYLVPSTSCPLVRLPSLFPDNPSASSSALRVVAANLGRWSIPPGQLVVGVRPDGALVSCKADVLLGLTLPAVPERWLGRTENAGHWQRFRAALGLTESSGSEVNARLAVVGSQWGASGAAAITAYIRGVPMV